MNEQPEPLCIYCFSRNTSLQKTIRKRSVSGSYCVNGTLHRIMSNELLFGGVGQSGMGRYFGRAGFETFSYTISVLEKKVSSRFFRNLPVV